MHGGVSRSYSLDGTRETLVTLGIVVLETNLEFDSFGEVALLLLGSLLDLANDFSDGSSTDFAVYITCWMSCLCLVTPMDGCVPHCWM